MSSATQMPLWPIAIAAVAAVIYLAKVSKKKEGFTDAGEVDATRFVILDGKDFNLGELARFGKRITEDIVKAPTAQKARAQALETAAQDPKAVGVKVTQEGGRVVYRVVYAETEKDAKAPEFRQYYQFYTSGHVDRGLFIKQQ